MPLKSSPPILGEFPGGAHNKGTAMALSEVAPSGGLRSEQDRKAAKESVGPQVDERNNAWIRFTEARCFL